MKHRVVYDCDNTMGLPWHEVDDGLTLLYLLGRPDIELLGVTTIFGNGTIEEIYAQTEKLLHRLGRSDIPLWRGEGERGEGPTEAARFLVQTASAQPGKVTLLATGPLGNLRAAAELDSSFFCNLKQIVCMGGVLRPLRIGYRNLAELNLSCDPEAAFAVLNAPCPVTLMHARVCMQALFRWWDLFKVKRWSAEMCRLLRHWLLVFGVYCGVLEFYLWDLLPAVYISYPELFDENPVTIRSTVADLESGMLVLAGEGEGTMINMPTQILDRKRFMAILYEAWARVVYE